jgi:hypothetical protein
LALDVALPPPKFKKTYGGERFHGLIRSTEASIEAARFPSWEAELGNTSVIVSRFGLKTLNSLMLEAQLVGSSPYHAVFFANLWS